MHNVAGLLIDGYELPFAFNSSEVIGASLALQERASRILSSQWKDVGEDVSALVKYFLRGAVLDNFFAKKKWPQAELLGAALRELWDAQYV